MGIISQKLRASAAGEVCTLAIPGVCNGNPETSVLCHAPSEIKGMGNKSHDFHAAIGCNDCHDALDQHRLTKADELFHWLRGIARTQALWFDRGLLIVGGVDPDRPKKRPGKKSKWASREIPSRPLRYSLDQPGQNREGD